MSSFLSSVLNKSKITVKLDVQDDQVRNASLEALKSLPNYVLADDKADLVITDFIVDRVVPCNSVNYFFLLHSQQADDPCQIPLQMYFPIRKFENHHALLAGRQFMVRIKNKFLCTILKKFITSFGGVFLNEYNKKTWNSSIEVLFDPRQAVDKKIKVKPLDWNSILDLVFQHQLKPSPPPPPPPPPAELANKEITLVEQPSTSRQAKIKKVTIDQRTNRKRPASSSGDEQPKSQKRKSRVKRLVSSTDSGSDSSVENFSLSSVGPSPCVSVANSPVRSPSIEGEHCVVDPFISECPVRQALELNNNVVEELVDHFRKLGFRCIGQARFFALVYSPGSKDKFTTVLPVDLMGEREIVVLCVAENGSINPQVEMKKAIKLLGLESIFVPSGATEEMKDITVTGNTIGFIEQRDSFVTFGFFSSLTDAVVKLELLPSVLRKPAVVVECELCLGGVGWVSCACSSVKLKQQIFFKRSPNLLAHLEPVVRVAISRDCTFVTETCTQDGKITTQFNDIGILAGALHDQLVLYDSKRKQPNKFVFCKSHLGDKKGVLIHSQEFKCSSNQCFSTAKYFVES